VAGLEARKMDQEANNRLILFHANGNGGQKNEEPARRSKMKAIYLPGRERMRRMEDQSSGACEHW